MTADRSLHPAAARRPGSRRLGWNLLGLLVFVTAGFPVYWMLNTAFKPAKDAIDPDPSLLPTGLTLDNFRRALDIADFWGPVGRSLDRLARRSSSSASSSACWPRSPSPGSPSAAARS